MPNFTPQQTAVIEAASTGESGKARAYAGAGKTTVLKGIAKANRKRSFAYLAYNKSIATEAQESFPRNVECRTAHSFAFQAVGKQYADRLRGPRVPSWRVANFLHIYDTVEIGNQLFLGPNQQARLALDTVKRFTYSADLEPGPKHVPWVNGATNFDDLARRISTYAKRIWEDAISKRGTMKFEHDHYLKLWAMTNPELPVESLLVDESQDLNPVLSDVCMKAHERGQQVILVGDPYQQIYAWRGAEDAMEKFTGAKWSLPLSQSFRFGSAIAGEANKWLRLLGAEDELIGFNQIESQVRTLANPSAVLCRTNATAVAEAMELMNDGYTVAIVGGTSEIVRFAEAARDLQNGKPTSHPDLLAFDSWEKVVEYVGSGEGQDLKKFVDLLNNYGVERVLEITSRTVAEKDADVVVSTAHKAKGREWDDVKIASDFRQPDPDPITGEQTVNRPEFMLAYVSVTRAMKNLDASGLSWIDMLIKDDETENKEKEQT